MEGLKQEAPILSLVEGIALSYCIEKGIQTNFDIRMEGDLSVMYGIPTGNIKIIPKNKLKKPEGLKCFVERVLAQKKFTGINISVIQEHSCN